MVKTLRAVGYVILHSLRPFRRSQDVKDALEISSTILQWIFPFLSVGLTVWLQSHIPGIKNMYPWAMPVIVAVLAYAGMVFVTAVRLRLRIVDIEERITPCLEILGVAEEHLGHTGAGWSLEIRNNGTHPAKGCHGKVEDIEFETQQSGLTLRKWPRGRDLQWSGQPLDAHEYEIGGGQSAMLNLVYRTSAAADNAVILAYKDSERFRRDHKLPKKDFPPILLLINLVNEGRLPQYGVCLINVESVSSDIYRGISNEPAVSLLYSGEQRRSLSEFQSNTDLTVTSGEDELQA